MDPNSSTFSSTNNIDVDTFSEDSFIVEPVLNNEPVPENQPLVSGGSKIKPTFTVKKAEFSDSEESEEESVSTEEDEEKDEDENEKDSKGGKSDDSSSEDSESESSTIDCLSRDPLFLVLSQFLTSEKKNINIVDALCKINKSLKHIIKILKHK
jgi:hypothetical protein